MKNLCDFKFSMSTYEVYQGSFRVLWKVSLPLMIACLSAICMTFIDRLFLSYYSISALTAATSVGNFYLAGCFMWMTFASMSQIFVAQHNGAKQYKKLGESVWQMVYLSVGSILFFSFLGSFGSDFFFVGR